MEIIFIILSIIIILLIFFFVKKIIFTIIGVVLFFLLILISCATLIYIDLSNIAEYQTIELNLVYEKNGEFIRGINYIHKENIDTNNLSMLENIKPLKNISLENLIDESKKSENKFVIIVNEELLTNTLEDKEYDLLKELSISNDFFSLVLNKSEMIDIINDEYEGDKFEMVSPMLEVINFNNFDYTDMIFLFSLREITKNPENLILIINYYKEDKIEVYPKRFSFQIIKYVPTFWIEFFIPEEVMKTN